SRGRWASAWQRDRADAARRLAARCCCCQPVEQRVYGCLTRVQGGLLVVCVGNEQRRLVERREQHVRQQLLLSVRDAPFPGQALKAQPQAAERVLLVELPPAGPSQGCLRIEQRDPLNRRVEGHLKPGMRARAQSLERVA